eukprot:2761602-Amphidinium_carterae.1
MFKGIAVSFLAQHSAEEALWLAAKSIARRLEDMLGSGKGDGSMPSQVYSMSDSSRSVGNRAHGYGSEECKEPKFKTM